MLRASSIGIGLSFGRELIASLSKDAGGHCMSSRRVHEYGTQISRIGSDNDSYGWELQAQK